MRKLLIGLIVSLIAAGNGLGQENSSYCTYFGGMTEKVCPVSMVTLTLRHQSFLGKNVAVSGYVGKVDGKFYLFTTREFYTERSMADSVLLRGHEDRISKYPGKRITVIGRVSPADGYDDDIFRPFAKINVQLIR